MKYRADIDGLRAIAVSSVIIFHVFPNILPGGYIGVDIFFVISGYLISSIIYKELEEGSFSLTEFYCRRVRRIFPSLIVVLISCYIIGWYLFYPDEYQKLSAHIAAAAGFSSNFLLYAESGYFDAAANSKPLLHLWSLGIEEQFYIVWPVLCYVLWTKKVNLFFFTILLTLCSFTLNTINIKSNKSQTFYWPTTRAWELLIGACLAFKPTELKCYFKRCQPQPSGLLVDETIIETADEHINHVSFFAQLTSISGLVLVFLALLFLKPTIDFPGWWALCPTICTALLIFLGQRSLIGQIILSSRLFVEVGRISYPLYRWHWPLMVFFRSFENQEPTFLARFYIILVSILLALICKIFVEKLFRFGNFLQVKCISLCILMVFIGFIGYHTYKLKGLPNRFFRISPHLMPLILNNDNIFKGCRLNTCFIDLQKNEWKFESCVDNNEKHASTGVVIWGDSHAAHLYPGISALKPKVRLTQLTAGLCPSILVPPINSRPRCEDINKFIFNRIMQEKPNTVILSNFWMNYNWNETTLEQTIMKLRNTSVKNIYLVGPSSLWKYPFKNCFAEALLKIRLRHKNDRTKECLDNRINAYDEKMRNFAVKNEVIYISPYKTFCNSNGCMLLAGKNESKLITYDGNHLTEAGSIYLVSHFPKMLLRVLQVSNF